MLPSIKTFFHPAQLLHLPKSYLSRGRLREPQEVPERALRLIEAVRRLGFEICEPRDHGMSPLLDVHDGAYVEFLQAAHSQWTAMSSDWGDEVISNIYVAQPNALRGVLAQAARYLADGSCPIGPHTWRSAYWSAQSAIGAGHALLAGDSCAYALCRPPGHHARKGAAGGFSYLNNIAIATQALLRRFPRIAILDADMHHGQGVQEIFYDRADVYYVSIHGDPTNFYPVVCGHADERGKGAGEGFNLNLTMAHGADEATFFDRLQTAAAAIERFMPDALVVALGFDIYSEDPQSQVDVSSDGFTRLGGAIRALRRPTLVVQEGGYHLETLERNATNFFTGLLVDR